MNEIGEQLRQCMRHWPAGVTVVTSQYGAERHGMTVNSFTSVSLAPPVVSVTLANDTRTCKMLLASGILGITILNEDQAEISERFAGHIPDEGNRFIDLELFTLTTGVPFLAGGLAFLDCRVRAVYPLDNSSLFLLDVVAAQSSRPIPTAGLFQSGVPKNAMNPVQKLNEQEKAILLSLARRSIELAVNQRALPQLKLEDYPPPLREIGASFVTLMIQGELRGCIGALEPYQPLVQDVCEHAAAAALEDYRFSPLAPAEVPLIEIEISRLTAPQPLEYTIRRI